MRAKFQPILSFYGGKMLRAEVVTFIRKLAGGGIFPMDIITHK